MCERSKVASLFLKKFLPKIPEFSLRLALFMDSLGAIPFPNTVTWSWLVCKFVAEKIDRAETHSAPATNLVSTKRGSVIVNSKCNSSR